MSLSQVFRSRRTLAVAATAALAMGATGAPALAQDNTYSADQQNAGWSDNANARAFKAKLNRYADRGNWQNAYRRSIAQLDARLDECMELRTALSEGLQTAPETVSAAQVREYRNCVATTGVHLSAYDEALAERETELMDGADDNSASTRWPQVAELRASYSDVRSEYDAEEDMQRALIASYNEQEKLATR